ncbi:MAG: histidinol-phosphatase HisJ family protein [Lachnospiraceae bacterium]|jgi:histidinol-phosphatase (PHP family)|nr:histidinol-phosphatase HisJ family protein [Lachnospiraceae bacterium]
MLWDTHIHTCHSVDSTADLEETILSAIQYGLEGICITDHVDYDHPKCALKKNKPEEFVLNTANQNRELLPLKEKYQDQIQIFTGTEIGLQTHVVDENVNYIAKNDFDFIIASSHAVHGFDPCSKPYFEGKTEENAYREYFECILENITVFDDFDIYGHIDYIVRYDPNRNANYTYQKYADLIDEIYIQLIQKGKGIELNTAGLKYGLGHPHPTEDALKRYRELGGEIITIGSDAHIPEHVGYDFHLVPDYLKNAGFRYYTVFENRKPRMKKL